MSPRISEIVRLRLDIAYDGTEFAGWAAQSEQRTVAGVLDEALTTVFRAPVRLRAAGRTDAGVHATGQVAHADVPVESVANARGRSPRDGDPQFMPLVRRLGRFLPADVRVTKIARAPEGFDARFSALRRHYVYRLSSAPYGVLPHLARYVTAWPRPLNLDSMNTASRDLLGLHDFAAFCRRRDGATTVRLDWSLQGDLITAHVSADAFCWSMVRSLVGALLAVGEDRRPVSWCGDVLAAAVRCSDYAAAPAHGLTLVGVDYPPDDQLPARNLLTRDMRSPMPRESGA